MHIFVNNLPFSTTEGELAHLFEPYSSVKRARIATDYNTGRSLGFGFIEMPDPTEGQTAIDRLQGRPFGGQNLTIGYIASQGGTPTPPPALDAKFEWYKKEHETLSKHLEEAAKSSALNFSYVAIVSAALLTFSCRRLQLKALFPLSLLPICIWLPCVLWPFARYIANIGHRLSDIEQNMKPYGISRGHFTAWFQKIQGVSSGKRPPKVFLPILIVAFIVLGLAVAPLALKCSESQTVQECWETHAIVPEKITKVQFMDANLQPAIQAQLAENKNEWHKRFDGIEVQFQAMEHRLATLEASAKAAEGKTSDLQRDVKQLLNKVPNEGKKAKPQDKAPSP